MNEQSFTPFQVSRYFQEHVGQVLNALQQDSDGMYQITYRVGDLMIAAQIWRESAPESSPEFSAADLKFLKQCNVTVEDAFGGII
jgi:hypothetical protein